MMTDPKVQRIIEWRESLSILSDDKFFSIIRMYLGEVKTPYNKQKLIESLGAFIRTEENKKAIISLLTTRDLQILTFISLVNDATEDKICSFFNNQINKALLLDYIVNLKERLLIYSHKRISDGAYVLSINPILEDTLSPFLNKDILFMAENMEEIYDESSFLVSPQYIASFLSYLKTNGDLCKNDGQFKKGTVNRLNEIFNCNTSSQDNIQILQLLNKGLCNLGILHDTDKGIICDDKRLELFSQFEHCKQLAYIAAASIGHFGRSGLQSNAQLLLDTLAELINQGYSLPKIIQLSVLIKNKASVEPRRVGGRFAEIMQKASVQSSNEQPVAMEAILESCISFGILFCCGINTEGQKVYKVSPMFFDNLYDNNSYGTETPKVISIDAGFSLSLLPGLNLKQLISITNFSDIVKYDTVVLFEITKQAVLNSFDNGYTPESIFDVLTLYSNYELPQNLKISIEEWFTSYNSASLYKGYVLKVSDDNAALVKANPILSKYLKTELASGVFLLDFTNDVQAESVILKSGLNFIGNIKTVVEDNEVMALPSLYINRTSTDYCDKPRGFVEASDIIEQKKILDEYKDYVNSLDISDDQKQGLIERINGRIILSKVQLRPESVRFEKLEAFGMDYTGKIHVIESAIANNCMIEIDLDGYEKSLIGRPSGLNKKSGNAEFVFMTEPEHQAMIIAVSAASRIKKLRNSLYC